jgi:hypothetical protein
MIGTVVNVSVAVVLVTDITSGKKQVKNLITMTIITEQFIIVVQFAVQQNQRDSNIRRKYNKSASFLADLSCFIIQRFRNIIFNQP